MTHRSRKLLEREGELDLLASSFEGLESSGGQTVLIRGEAGIGKTTLVKEFIACCADSAHVLVGACDDLSTARPLGPLWDMARDETGLSEALESDDRSDVMRTILDLMSRSLRPTIVLIEDTQWVDEATLDVITFLGRRISEMNALLLLTYRDGDVDLDHPLRKVMGELPAESVVRIRLGGVSLDGVATLVAGSGFDAHEVYAATDGNPFLTIQVASGDPGVIPTSVQDSVLARMRRLSTEGQDVLKIFSVIPGKVSPPEVEALVGDASDGPRECEQSELLRVVGDSVAFRHDLIRRAVEASLTPSERVSINRLVLDSLPAETDPARLVHHAQASHDTARLIELAPRAARAALIAGSLREAVAYFRLLAPHIDVLAEEDKGEILDDWMFAEALENDYNPAMQTNQLNLDHYRAVGDPGGESRALGNAAFYYEALLQRVRAEQSLHEAVEALGPDPDGADLARILEGNAFLAVQAGDATAAIDLVDRALEAAGPDVDQTLLVRGLVHKGAAADIAHYPAGQIPLDEARQLAEAAGNWVEAWRALINHAVAAADNYDIPVASDYAQRAKTFSVDHDMGVCSTYSSATYARSLLLQGQWDRAEELARDQLERTNREIVHVCALPVLGTIEGRKGRASARTTLHRAWDIAIGSGEFLHLAPVASAIAEHAWITGDVGDIPMSEIRQMVGTGQHRGREWLAGSIAFWLWKLDELDEIPEGIAEPWRLTMEGEPIKAAQIWADRGCPYEQAIALSHGDTTARLEAVEILDGLGATAVSAKLRQDLREAGVVVPRRRPRRSDQHSGLTARQNEVLLLLNERMSNVEIADQLFLSPRTVEHHVAAVISKLDASSRDEAVTKAAEQGLLAEV